MNKTSGLRYGNYHIYGYLDYDFYDSGKDGCTKLDKFSEKFQTAFDPPSHFWKLSCKFFMTDMVAYMKVGMMAR